MCNLKDVETHEKLNISNEGIIISDKIAEFVNAKVGDSVVLIDNDNLNIRIQRFLLFSFFLI